MTTNIQTQTTDKALLAAVEQAITAGNLAALNPAQKLYYYNQVCASVGLNPLTRPLDFIQLNGKLVLYAKKDATDQIRKIHGVSITKIEQLVQEGCCIVTAYAKDKNGKEDSDMGAVPVANLKGDQYANAIMKAVTKAKRRVTLSICGMGLLDESELDTVKDAQLMPIDLAAKTDSQVEGLKTKVGASRHVDQKDTITRAPEADTPPPVPAAAKAPPKEPEVLPAAKKPGRPPKAQPAEAPKAAPAPEPAKLGDTLVLWDRYQGRTLDSLEDRELRDVQAWVNKGIQVEKWDGPNFVKFCKAFKEYANGFTGFEDEPEEVPPPPPQEDDVEAFMSTPYEEEPKQDASPLAILVNRIKWSKNKEELDDACNRFKKEVKPIFQGMKPEDAKTALAEAQRIRDEKKLELGI